MALVDPRLGSLCYAQVARGRQRSSLALREAKRAAPPALNLRRSNKWTLSGDVVVLDPDRPGRFRRAARAEDPTVLGVVATDADEGRAAVASSGLVLCRVDAGYGAIRPGDLLTTSHTPGHVMRADVPRLGIVLGKAIEALDTGTGTIRVLVTLR